jgi:hypothetical protein
MNVILTTNSQFAPPYGADWRLPTLFPTLERGAQTIAPPAQLKSKPVWPTRCIHAIALGTYGEPQMLSPLRGTPLTQGDRGRRVVDRTAFGDQRRFQVTTRLRKMHLIDGR